jgi:hypothetical protein
VPAFCNLYAERSLCERGYLESQPIQTHDYFLTSDWKIGIWYQFDYKNETALATMNAAVEECTAQKRLQIDLGPYYLNMYLATRVDAVPNHRDLASGIFQPIHPLALTQAVHANTIRIAEDTLCNNRNFQTVWDNYNCKQVEIDSCRMFTDDELMVIYETQWRPEFLTTPIKVYYQEIFDKCMKTMEANEPKEMWTFKDSQAWVNADNYFKDTINAQPLGIKPTVVIISGCGSTDGECQLVLPSK